MQEFTVLTVKPHVLGIGLAQRNRQTLRQEVAKSESVLVEVSTGEPLVRHVKKREDSVLLHERAHLLPLLRLKQKLI